MTTIKQTHDYDASPQTLYEHLTESQKLDTWWTTGSVSDPRPGGKYRYEFFVTKEAKKAGKEDHFQEGTYKVAEAGKRLEYPWNVGVESHVRIDLAPQGKGTRLTLTHTDLPPNDEVYQMIDGGWQFFLGNLKSVLSGGPDQRAAMGLQVPVKA